MGRQSTGQQQDLLPRAAATGPATLSSSEQQGPLSPGVPAPQEEEGLQRPGHFAALQEATPTAPLAGTASIFVNTYKKNEVHDYCVVSDSVTELKAEPWVLLAMEHAVLVLSSPQHVSLRH